MTVTVQKVSGAYVKFCSERDNFASAKTACPNQSRSSSDDVPVDVAGARYECQCRRRYSPRVSGVQH